MNAKLIITLFSLLLVAGVVIGRTEYKDVCITTLNYAKTQDPKELLKATILKSRVTCELNSRLVRRLIADASTDNSSKIALEDYRKLLESVAMDNDTAHTVVAKDGSGDYNSIQEAIDAYPKDLQGRYVVYVKEGTYNESVTVSEKQPNLYIYGDGNSKTIVTAAIGTGFIAKSMGFMNIAGSDGRHAVALHVASDYSAIFNCRIDGYQTSFSRQKHKTTNQQTTTMVIHNCTIVPDERLFPDRLKAQVYLGRPWKDYASTIFLENTMGDFIDPEGFISSKENFAQDTCIYYEYGNHGPRSNRGKRVKWSGAKGMSKAQAQAYTVSKLLKSDQFLDDVGIPHDGLIC
ncbi:hypothetical protein Pint_00775 [Pistacia integerrima]|uniref:Uncharacterized protein n=1 Tax=Pistacia integerrima TaxID=434235 RepID=A0ACC0ZP55_9ROSI|nr:hypothetical protein Pint_00775 [Pistacia integerrima]